MFTYTGRFAPSPTGPLHYGSLVTAVASYLQARAQAGIWRVRIEDIDPPRQPPGSIQSILETLYDYGFIIDGRPILQSQRLAAHKYFTQQMLAQSLAYPCECSRKQLAQHNVAGEMGIIYPRTCLHKKIKAFEQHNIRIKTSHIKTEFFDEVYGQQQCNLESQSSDYVIYRHSDLPSYILAVSLDDIYEKYTQVVRGADLLTSTHRQIHLSQLYGGRLPTFMHIPIITDDLGSKLSKQTFAPALSKRHARSYLIKALEDLGQEPPQASRWWTLATIWQWAIDHWQATRIPKVNSIKFNL